MRIVAGIFSFLALCLAAFVLLAMPRIPPNWLPWQTPDLDAASTWFAHVQINRLKFDRGACLAALGTASRLSFAVEPDRRIDDGCLYENVVRGTRTPIPVSPAPVATCAVHAAMYWWQLDLDSAARAVFGASLARIEQVGTFACRNVNSAAEGRRSQHASANAIDIAAFVLADGRRVAVGDWRAGGAPAVFLREAHRTACKYFNGVLGPDYNLAHASHFHLDMGPYFMCR